MKKDSRANPLKNMWDLLGRPIYVGDRLEANMKALFRVSTFTAMLGLVLVVMNIFTGQDVMLYAAIATFLGGAGCAYCARVLKRRDSR